ncbi:hypothetical protein ACGFZL_00580 [Streptomyces sp. NPDC048182]|uniref:hypothetical protein n=1 Tax=Streptomyces sp. NPDC048182 TaxID=3365507 RepID=UPI0037156A97
MRVLGRLLRHEARVLGSVAAWGLRRTPRGGPGRFGYARGQGAMAFGLGFVCLVETVMMALLLRRWPVAHGLVLGLDLYALLSVAGMYAAAVTHPHLLDAGTLRLRRAVHADVRIPLAHIASVRRELRTSQRPGDGALELAVGAQTSVTLELAEPVTHVSLLGRPRTVTVVRCHADDPDGLVRAVGAAARHAVP